jgi:hypothetical protein
MERNCEICGKPTDNVISSLEVETWEFNLENNGELFHTVCYECFDKHTDNYIAKDSNVESRKKNLHLVDESIINEINEMISELEQQ